MGRLFILYSYMGPKKGGPEQIIAAWQKKGWGLGILSSEFSAVPWNVLNERIIFCLQMCRKQNLIENPTQVLHLRKERRWRVHSEAFHGWKCLSRNDHFRPRFLLQEHPGKGASRAVNYDKQNPGFWIATQSPGLCCGACNKLCLEETVIILAPAGAAIVKSVTDSIVKLIFKQLIT